jgi:hypothetical protein
MNYWIIAANGQTYGPADLATLRRWVAESRVVGTTPVTIGATIWLFLHGRPTAAVVMGIIAIVVTVVR